MISQEAYWRSIRLLGEFSQLWSVGEATQGEISMWLNRDATPENAECLRRVLRAFRKLMLGRMGGLVNRAIAVCEEAKTLLPVPEPPPPKPLRCHACDEVIPLAGVAQPFHVVCPECWGKIGGKA